MNPIDKLRTLLDSANIPYRSVIMPAQSISQYIDEDPRSYTRNQIIYGEIGPHKWLLDAIWQTGSYGCNEGKLETYGVLGWDKNKDPRAMTPDEVFSIISHHYSSLDGDWNED